jgi:hypothetical protein
MVTVLSLDISCFHSKNPLLADTVFIATLSKMHLMTVTLLQIKMNLIFTSNGIFTF